LKEEEGWRNGRYEGMLYIREAEDFRKVWYGGRL
jgi:hypothetical protein